MWKPHLAFPTRGLGLCLPIPCKPQAAVKSIADNDGNHCSTEAWMTTFLPLLERTSLSCSIFWETSHFSSPGEDMENTHPWSVLWRALEGIFQAWVDNGGQSKSWLNFKECVRQVCPWYKGERTPWVFAGMCCSHLEQTLVLARGFCTWAQVRAEQCLCWAAPGKSTLLVHPALLELGKRVGSSEPRLPLFGWDHYPFLLISRGNFSASGSIFSFLI